MLNDEHPIFNRTVFNGAVFNKAVFNGAGIARCRRAGTGALLLAAALGQSLGAQVPELVLDIAPGNADGVGFPGGAVLGDALLFAGEPSGPGSESLWRTDGTAQGTFAIPDAGPESHRKPRDMTSVGDSLVVFNAIDDQGDRELWASDGVTAWLVEDIHPTDTSGAESFLDMGTFAFFFADDGEHGTELWRTDGTAAGTLLAHDFRPGPEESFLFGPARLGDLALVQAYVSSGATRFWGIDQSSQTVPLAGMGEGLDQADTPVTVVPGSDPPVSLFAGRTSTTGMELWRTDGTNEGTWLVTELCPGTSGCVWSRPVGFRFRTQSGAFFEGLSSDGAEPWISDGTEEGTEQLADLVDGVGSSNPEQFTQVGHQVFFVASHPDVGTELWRTDGTEEGTWLVRDIQLGDTGSDPRLLVGAGDELLFTAREFVTGYELWRSDGTQEGTELIADLAPGAAPNSLGGSPWVHVLGDRLIVLAEGDGVGREPHVLKLDDIFSDGFESGNTSAWSP